MMKTLLILALGGCVVALGGAFFGVWTVPGLEKFPTVDRLGKSRAGAVQSEAERRYYGEKPAKQGKWGAKQEGSLGTRTKQLQDSEGSLE